MTKKSDLPEFPKILTEKIEFALYCVKDLSPELVSEYLENYRWNVVQWTVAKGITSLPFISNPSSDNKKDATQLKFVPYERYEDIRRLDDAYQHRNSFLENGADDYVAKSVESRVNSLRGSRPRLTEGKTKDERYKEICDYMNRCSYKDSDDKETLMANAVAHFDVSEGTIYNALRWGKTNNSKK